MGGRLGDISPYGELLGESGIGLDTMSVTHVNSTYRQAQGLPLIGWGFEMTAIDFTMYVAGIAAIERSERLALEGRVTKTQWLVDSASIVVAALPPLGKRGAPVKGSDHAAMIEAIRDMFPDATDKGKAQQVTRCFNLCRIVAAHPLKDGEDFAKYMDRVSRWTTVTNTGTAEEIEQAITGVKRKATPPAPKDDATDSDSSESATAGKPKADPANLIPMIFDSTRTVMSSTAKGDITPEVWAQFQIDFAYMATLVKATHAPVAASA
jgi:hypothetical protein